ncbi:MAG: MFS transporter [Halodesulfurarchaeum sp.]
MSESSQVAAERGRFRVFGSLCLLVFLINFGRVVFAPLLDPFIRVFGVGEATVGLVATLAWFGSAISRLPTGYLLTRVSRHRVILATGVFLSVVAIATSFSRTIWHVGIGAFLIGIASGVYFIAANPLVSELYPDRVGRVIGIHGTASQLAAVVAPLSVGVFILYADWRLTFLALGVISLFVTLGLYWSTEHIEMPDVGVRNRHLRRSIENQWPIILTGIAVVGAASFVWNGFFNFFVRYLTTTKGLDFAVAQFLLTVLFAAGVPAFFYTGRLADRIPHVTLLLGVLGSFILTLVAMTFVDGVVPVAVVSLLMGYSIHSMFPAIDTYLLDSLPDADRSSAYSAYSASTMLVGSTASAVVGTLAQYGVHFDTMYRSFASILAIVFLVLMVLRRLGRLPDAARGE